ncbi:zinc ribbon domain-containing protein [Streptomyces sp. AJS327]|uniref:NADase-type glycan-binding domain-containing protein n=1 Tax=Streptomyces sp. AJS327 TaxID=2545265 RepID=UPI0018047014|nr:zinc ribbon domain-containing protein [Streptomyces sp. AJS327]MBA0051102.1 zinc ribbon domain-containing protein [Streptomyces sp. AJS327]
MTDPSSPHGNRPGGDDRRAEVCPECGTRPAPGQSFCDGCGNVLSWTPDPAGPGGGHRPSAPATPPTPTPETGAGAPGASASGSAGPPDPPSAGSGGSADADGNTGTAESAGSTAPGGPAAPPVTPPVAAPGPPSPPPPAPGGPDSTTETAPAARTDEEEERARALLIPVSDPEQRPAAHSPEAAPVLPGRPEPARPRVRAPGAGTEDGGLVCPWCETGNREDRHFCHRCAMSLAPRPAEPGRLPWWRRLTARDRPAPWAGDRPRLRRNLDRLLSWTVGVLVLSLVVYAAFNVGNAYNAVRDHFAKRAPTAPTSVRASDTHGKHDADLVNDRLNDTWWSPGISGSGKGAWIEARFDRPVRMLDLLITPGISARPDDLSKAVLPQRLEARITTPKGEKLTRTLTLDQASGAQRLKFRVGEVSSVRFIIRSVYGARNDKSVSIAEIEFFGRSRAGST